MIFENVLFTKSYVFTLILINRCFFDEFFVIFLFFWHYSSFFVQYIFMNISVMFSVDKSEKTLSNCSKKDIFEEMIIKTSKRENIDAYFFLPNLIKE